MQVDGARNNHPEEDKEALHVSLKSGWDVAIYGIDMCASFLIHMKDRCLVREQQKTCPGRICIIQNYRIIKGKLEQDN